MTEKPQKPWLTRWRGRILFFTGLTGVVFETVGTAYGKPADPSLLVLFAGMMGLPAFLPDVRGGDDD